MIGDDTMTDCPKVAATAHVHLCNSTYVSTRFVLYEMRNRGSTSDKFALGSVSPVSIVFISGRGAHVMPTSPDYLEIHNHAILRSIQEIIKMHTWFYVNGVAY